MEEESQVPFKQYFPHLSLSAYFWVVILVSLIVFGTLGYFVGIRVSELPSLTPLQQQIAVSQPSIAPGDDNDIDYSHISGNFVTNNNKYDQFVIFINGLPNGVTTMVDTDGRSFTKPVVGIQYPYFFSRLNPSRSYSVFASFCRVNPKTYALECAKNIKITKCTGEIQGQTCIIKGNGIESQSSGEVDFFEK